MSIRTFSTFSEMISSCSPCSCTMVATSLNSSFNSPTLCSIFLISLSRSMINDSWKSTSSCEARRSCSCSCCCWRPNPEPDCAVGDGASASRAARPAAAEARSFSRAVRWRSWNSRREAWNSRFSFDWVNRWAGCRSG